MTKIEVNSIKLTYTRRGTVKKMLLLHGNSGSGRQLKKARKATL